MVLNYFYHHIYKLLENLQYRKKQKKDQHKKNIDKKKRVVKKEGVKRD